MKPLCKTDLADVYNQMGIEFDPHDGFCDMNKEYLIRRQVKGRIQGKFDVFKIKGKLDTQLKDKYIDKLCEHVEQGHELKPEDLEKLNEKMLKRFNEQRILRNNEIVNRHVQDRLNMAKEARATLGTLLNKQKTINVAIKKKQQ